MSVTSPIRPRSCRAAGNCAHPASCPCVVATSRSAPALRSSRRHQPERRGRPEPHRRAPVLPQQPDGPPGHPGRRQQHRRGVPYDGEGLLGVERGRRPDALAGTLPGGGVDDEAVGVEAECHVVQERLDAARAGREVVRHDQGLVHSGHRSRPYPNAAHSRAGRASQLSGGSWPHDDEGPETAPGLALDLAPARTPDATAGDLGRDPADPAALRLQGVPLPRPGRHHRRLRHLPGLVRGAAHRNVPAGRRHLAVPARRSPGDPLPRPAPVPRLRVGLLPPGLPGRPGRPRPAAEHGPAPRPVPARRVDLGGGRPAARPDRLLPLRRHGDGGRGRRAAHAAPGTPG